MPRKPKPQANGQPESPPLRLEWRDPAELAENPLNWRRHPEAQTAALTDVLAEVGWAGACLYNEATGRLIDGHARRKVALEQGGKKVPVLIGSWDEAQERKILATLDPLAAMAEADAAALDALLRDVQTGSAAVAEMLAGLANEAGLAYGDTTEPGGGGDDFDATPEDAGPTRTALGELWVIGGTHRLLVGDCTVPENVARLMGGGKAQGAFTSPPYAEQRKDTYGGIAAEKYCDWWVDVQSQVRSCLAADGSFFVNIKPHCENGQRSCYVFDLVLAMVRMWSWRFVEEYCWTHEGTPINPTAGRYKNAFEPVYHFALTESISIRPDNVKHESERVAKWVPGRGNKTQMGNFGINGDVGPGLALPSNVVHVNKGDGRDDSAIHPAKFPLGLPSFFLSAFSDAQAIWLDPFLGSGTTLIAAHRLGRRCYGCEVEPRYADVVLKRAEAEGLSCEKEM